MADVEARRRAAGIGLMVAAVSVFACMDTIAKYLSRDYPVPMIVWARYFFQMVAMLVILGPRQRLRLVRTRRPGFQIVRGIVLTLSSLSFFTALAHMQLAEASAITFLAPLFVAILAGPVLHERVPAASWIAIITGLVGMQFIIRPGTEVFSWWALLPMCNAILMAAYQLMTRRIASVDPATTTLFYPAVVGSVGLALALPAVGVWPIHIGHALLFLVLGVLGGAGHLLLIRAYQRAPASLLAPFMYAQLAMALTLGFLVFGNFPDAWALLGMAIIVASGVMLLTHQGRQL
jgi:drug/metabolite transporter (DMT)-like permease